MTGGTDWPLVAVRFALYATLTTLFGLAAFALHALRGEERRTALRLGPWLGGSAVLGLILSTASLVVMAASMAGTSPLAVDRETVAALATAPGVGAAWMVRTAALAVAALLALQAGSAPVLAAVAIAGGIALGSLAWNGHAAIGEGAAGWARLGADVVHLLAAGVWTGALVALALLAATPAARATRAQLVLTHRALRGFSIVGTVVVGLLVASGLVGAWALVGLGNVASLGASPYGRLLIAKLLLFGAMLALAALNRFRLTPAFRAALDVGDTREVMSVLRRSLGFETACAFVILALVAWLGTLAPPGGA